MKHRALAFLRRLLKSTRLQRTERVVFIDEKSTLIEIQAHYPESDRVFTNRFHLDLTEEMKTSALAKVCRDNFLPSPQIVFMEIQLAHAWPALHKLAPKQAHQMMADDADCILLDVRDPCERDAFRFERAQPFSVDRVSAIDRDRKILLCCHFGIRSMDVGAQLVTNGYRKVYVLDGGLHAWSREVDPSFPTYEGPPCD